MTFTFKYFHLSSQWCFLIGFYFKVWFSITFFLTFLFELVLLFEFAVGRQMDFLMKLPAQAEKLSF